MIAKDTWLVSADNILSSIPWTMSYTLLVLHVVLYFSTEPSLMDPKWCHIGHGGYSLINGLNKCVFPKEILPCFVRRAFSLL